MASDDYKQRAEQFGKTFDKFMVHYEHHIAKVILSLDPDCGACHKMIELGKVIEDEGKATKGISRTVNSFGNEAYVLVPKSWLGKKVKVSLIE